MDMKVKGMETMKIFGKTYTTVCWPDKKISNVQFGRRGYYLNGRLGVYAVDDKMLSIC